MPNEELILYIVPSLVATLLSRGRAKGSALTEQEVFEIRDNCQAIAVPRAIARSMDDNRGYRDIDPENCWAEWLRAREELELPNTVQEQEELQKARKQLAERDGAKMAEPLAQYLGKPASDLLASPPFNAWRFERRDHDDELDSGPSYKCAERGLELNCAGDGTIDTIFLKVNHDNQAITNIRFSSSRSEVSTFFGAPSQSGAAYKHAILGEYGPWDRFDGAICTLHVEYEPYIDQIKMLTFMRPHVVP